MNKNALIKKKKESLKKKDYRGMLSKLIRNIVKIPKVIPHDKGFRPSAIGTLCIRERVFAYNLKVDVPVDVFDHTGFFFTEVGTSVHTLTQDTFLRMVPVLKGNWKCHTCKTEWEDQYAPETCEWCEGHNQRSNIKYEEYKVVDTEDTGFTTLKPLEGHVDGVICLNRLEALYNGVTDREELDKIEEDLALLEIKTSGSRVFPKVLGDNEPPEYYKIQAVCYQKCSGIDKTLFLYIERDTGKLGDFIYEGEERLWKLVRKKQKDLDVGRTTGLLPVEKECSHFDCDRAKKCPFRDMCFGIKELPPNLSEPTTSSPKLGSVI